MRSGNGNEGENDGYPPVPAGFDTTLLILVFGLLGYLGWMLWTSQ